MNRLAPLDNKQFLDLAIQHFPPDVRSALIGAGPTNFAEAVVLLKQLQGRKVADRNSDFSSGQLNTSRRYNPRQNNFQSSGAGADHQSPTQSAQKSPGTCHKKIEAPDARLGVDRQREPAEGKPLDSPRFRA